MKQAVVTGLMASVLCAGAVYAAETRPPAAAFGGPVIKGMCILNRNEIFSTAKVSQAVNTKYRQALEQAQGEVNKERTALEADIKAVQDKKASLKPEELQKSQTELNDRLARLQKKANEHTQELEVVRRSVVARIATEAQPLIEQVYKERGCGVLLSRDAVLAGNAEMDITTAVIAALDKKITDLPFTKEAGAGAAAQ